jgi:hypothetical protein
MGQLGIGVMLAMLGGNEESARTFSDAIGKEITALSIDDNALHFTLADGTKFMLFDDGQSCCESRYMRTDDDLAYHVGANLLSAETRAADEKAVAEDDWGGVHDIEFLVVTTSKGTITVSNHNEHNGYYGGFAMRAKSE